MAESLIQKSTIVKIKEPDFSQEVVITVLHADKNAIDWHFNQMKKTLGENVKDEEIWKRIETMVLRDNVFNKAMQIIVPCYQITIDPTDLEAVSKRVKESNPEIAQAGEQVLYSFTSRIIEKKLVFDQLAKEWNITVTDEDAKNMLENYYKMTNQPIRDLVADKNAIEGIKATMLEQKIASTIISKLKWRPDWDAIRKSAQQSAAANQPKQETQNTENKQNPEQQK